MNSIEEIINDNQYIAEEVGSITIDGNIYDQYSSYTFSWDKRYVRDPERAQDGSISNLEATAFFIVAHLIINYDIMPINLYRQLIKQNLEKNEFTVKFYDPVNDTLATRKMYLATPQMPNFEMRPVEVETNGVKETKVKIIGVKNYTVELIGTNNV